MLGCMSNVTGQAQGQAPEFDMCLNYKALAISVFVASTPSHLPIHLLLLLMASPLCLCSLSFRTSSRQAQGGGVTWPLNASWRRVRQHPNQMLCTPPWQVTPLTAPPPPIPSQCSQAGSICHHVVQHVCVSEDPAACSVYTQCKFTWICCTLLLNVQSRSSLLYGLLF